MNRALNHLRIFKLWSLTALWNVAARTRQWWLLERRCTGVAYPRYCQRFHSHRDDLCLSPVDRNGNKQFGGDLFRAPIHTLRRSARARHY